jgi:hypothetical protein
VPNIPKGQKSFWTHQLALRGNAAQIEAQFSSFRESGNLDARSVHGLHQTYHRLRNHFGCTRREPLGEVGLVKCHFGLFGDSVSVGAR